MVTAAPRRYLTCAETAKLVRKALAGAFPGVKFSVRSDTYAGGASIRVRWFDGPTPAQVEAVTGFYSGASFDGMIDLKSYHDRELNGEWVHFGADWVECRRDYTAPFLRRIAAEVCVNWGYALGPIATEADGAAYLLHGHSYPRVNTWDYTTLADLIYQAQCQTPAPAMQRRRKPHDQY